MHKTRQELRTYLIDKYNIRLKSDEQGAQYAHPNDLLSAAFNYIAELEQKLDACEERDFWEE